MLPFKSIIHVDKELPMPVYLQIAKSLIAEIANGRLGSGDKLPGSRKLSELLEVHRKTVVAAYEELEIQGWVVSKGTSGTYVNKDIPVLEPASLTTHKSSSISTFQSTGAKRLKYSFDDGHPDVRLAPTSILTREFNSLVRDKYFVRNLNYENEFRGDIKLRQSLSQYLRDTRGIVASPDEILITRGSIMAFYLLINQYYSGKTVVVGKPNYPTFNHILRRCNGHMLEVPVDREGINVDCLEELCQKQKVDLVYVISHHHHPTTVKLIPERRIKLLNLSEEYDFRVLEDDYDYDFHYQSSPVLPLASFNNRERVVYVGSFSKTMVPAIRLGFLVSDESTINDLALLRRFIDRVGDPLVERAMSTLLKEGEIRRHINKSLVAYKQRRDLLCNLLRTELSERINFDTPEGGMAVWVQFDGPLDLSKMIMHARENDLGIMSPDHYQSVETRHTRMGFASMNLQEIETSVGILIEAIKVA